MFLRIRIFTLKCCKHLTLENSGDSVTSDLFGNFSSQWFLTLWFRWKWPYFSLWPFPQGPGNFTQCLSSFTAGVVSKHLDTREWIPYPSSGPLKNSALEPFYTLNQSFSNGKSRTSKSRPITYLFFALFAVLFNATDLFLPVSNCW